GFGPGMFLAPQILTQADANGDRKLTQEEFLGLADRWFAKLDPEKTGKLSQDQFTTKLSELLPPPPGRGGFGPPGGGAPGGGRGGFGPAMFIGRGLFTVVDSDKNGSLTAPELKDTFRKWFVQWDANKAGTLDEEALRAGLNEVMPRPEFGGPGGRRNPGGPGGPSGPGGGGVNLDPLVAANDASKPLISKLLAVPALRTRYLRLVHAMAERSLDWNKLGPIVAHYQGLITADVKADTRKLESFEAFQRALATESQTTAARSSGGDGSLKGFAEQRRAFLLNHAEVKKACN
ncbi:MAG TPA: CotH kinase family protein, partial [Candidatus Sulfotelmatobacter sp.]|nr:CotH kinase family protein [Candidatus Sulfotelmatobacter sp.]